ncbi:MAG: glycosyltransferase family 39 protein [Anaerolineae bacterium]|nr:glycosyltransferase family 39 protein [Anaerolineae bacterium]
MTANIQNRTQFKHWALVVILILFGGLATAYNLTLPLGEVSDASAHFALIRFIAEEGRPPLTLSERSEVGIKGDASPVYHGLVALLTQHVDISSFPELPRMNQADERAIPDDQRLILTYFHTEDEAWPFRGIALTWHLAGLMSLPMGMATIIAVYSTVLVMVPQRRYFAVAAAAFVAFLPRFIISSAVINDDNLVFPLIAFSLYVLIKIIHGDEQRRMFIILGLLIGLAAITKYHSLILLPETALVLIILGWRRGWEWIVTLRRGLWLLAAFVVTSGWWLGFILIKFNDIENAGLISGLAAPFGDPVVTEGSAYLFSTEFNTLSIWKFDYWINWTFRSFWLHYNGLDSGMQLLGRQTMYWAVYILFGGLMIIASLGLLIKSINYGKNIITMPQKLRHWRLDYSLLAIHFLIYLALIILRYMLFPAWSTSQGRHLYPALTSIAFFWTLGLDAVQHQIAKSFSTKLVSPFFTSDKLLVVVSAGIPLLISIAIVPLFFRPVYYPLLPITTTHPDKAAISHRLTNQFADELRFEGYDIDQTKFQPGQAIPLTLYWRTRIKQNQDYLIQMCLHDTAGTVVTCHQSYPVNGRYPVRAWEEGYLIKDQVYVPTPSCLPSGEYELRLSAVPLNLETLAPTIDESISPQPSLSLGSIQITDAPLSTDTSVLWINNTRYTKATVLQLRQTLTLLQEDTLSDPRLITDSVADPWLPFNNAITYTCPHGATVSTYSFITHPGVKPGLYHLETSSTAGAPNIQVDVMTRVRNFTPPDDVGTEVGAIFDNKIELLGYKLDTSPRSSGSAIEITTYWRSLATMSHSYIGSFHLLDNTSTMWAQSDSPLGSDYPTVLWSPGEVITSTYKLPINPFVAAGQYSIKFSVYNYNEGNFDFLAAVGGTVPEPVTDLYLAQIRILDSARQSPPDTAMDIHLGDDIQLLGYTIENTTITSAEPVRMALFWQARQPVTQDYTIFTQLIGPDGQVWAQQDNQPQGGSFPTSTWSPFDTVVDRYELPLNEGAPPGQYQLLVGQYDLNTGQRLPAVDAQGQRLSNDAIVLTTITLE